MLVLIDLEWRCLMAVAFVFRAEGVTREQYDAMMAAIGRAELDAPIPDGIVSHVSGPVGDGWFVVDVWESEDQANAFYGSDTFGQAAQANLPPLQPEMVPLHRIEVYKTLRALDLQAA